MDQDSTSWQTKCGGLSARLGAVRARGLWTDCELLVGEEKAPVRVHRLLLAAASPVLAAMLDGPLADPDKPLHLPDVDTETFQLLLEYMYTDNITISSFPVAVRVYGAANYLILPHVQEICKTFIINNLLFKHVLSAYEFSELCGDEEIMDKCLEIMSNFTSRVLEYVENVHAKTLQRLFALPSLAIASELELFQAAERWVHARCSASLGQKHGADLQKNETKPISLENPNAKDLGVGNAIPMEAENGKVDSASGDNIDPIKLQSVHNLKTGADCGAGGDTKYVKLECNGDAIPNVESFDDLNKKNNARMLIRDVLKEIRFLTMDLEEFAGHDMSMLLSDSEMSAILLNLKSSKCHKAMPDGFSLSREKRNLEVWVEWKDLRFTYYFPFIASTKNFTCTRPEGPNIKVFTEAEMKAMGVVDAHDEAKAAVEAERQAAAERERQEKERQEKESIEMKMEEQERLEHERPRPISSTPIPGTSWYVVWTSDRRVFFYNPTMRVSVWERPAQLIGRADVDRAVSQPPAPLGVTSTSECIATDPPNYRRVVSTRRRLLRQRIGETRCRIAARPRRNRHESATTRYGIAARLTALSRRERAARTPRVATGARRYVGVLPVLSHSSYRRAIIAVWRHSHRAIVELSGTTIIRRDSPARGGGALQQDQVQEKEISNLQRDRSIKTPNS